MGPLSLAGKAFWRELTVLFWSGTPLRGLPARVRRPQNDAAFWYIEDTPEAERLITQRNSWEDPKRWLGWVFAEPTKAPTEGGVAVGICDTQRAPPARLQLKQPRETLFLISSPMSPPFTSSLDWPKRQEWREKRESSRKSLPHCCLQVEVRRRLRRKV